MEASASDNVAVQRVWFVRWDAVNLVWVDIGTDYGAPYQASIACSTLNYDANQINVVAYDTSGNSNSKHVWIYRLHAATPTSTPTLTGSPTPTATPTPMETSPVRQITIAQGQEAGHSLRLRRLDAYQS